MSEQIELPANRMVNINMDMYFPKHEHVKIQEIYNLLLDSIESKEPVHLKNISILVTDVTVSNDKEYSFQISFQGIERRCLTSY
jgi:hypothetical protein